MHTVLLKAQQVSKTYRLGIGMRMHKKVLNGISINIYAGKTVGIVGDSGIGKTTLANIVAGIEKPTAGKILYRGENIAFLNHAHLSGFRRDVQMMFQDPEGALNPLKTVERLLHEVCNLAQGKKRNWENRISEILHTVGLSEEILCRYPRQLSGGQNQRVALGRILLLEPAIIILDEPTSALDISVQAQILHLLKDLQVKRGLGYLFISHDFDVVDFMCDEVGFLENGVFSFHGTPEEFQKYRVQHLVSSLDTGSNERL
jgi:peptide/nickel transport system ATP-binding protein